MSSTEELSFLERLNYTVGEAISLSGKKVAEHAKKHCGQEGQVSRRSAITLHLATGPLSDEKFYAYQVALERFYGPHNFLFQKESKQAPVAVSEAQTVDNNVELHLVALSRDQTTLLSKKEVDGIIKELNGASLTGETGYTFSVSYSEEPHEVRPFLADHVLTLSQITDARNGQPFPLMVKVNLDHSSKASAILQEDDFASSSEQADQDMKNGALVSSPIHLARPYGIEVALLGEDGQPLTVDDPNLQKEIVVGLRLGSRILEISMEAISGKPVEIEIPTRGFQELEKFQNVDSHPDWQWLRTLWNADE